MQWADYCSEHGEDTYEWCRHVMQVKEYAMKAKEKGTKLYVPVSYTHLLDRDLAGNAKKVGDYFAAKLEKLPHVKEVRRCV